MSFNRLNNLTGWAVFGLTLLVYLLTMAPTASFWDCGEFIACANELEVTHPPGAPFFLLLGRLFALFSAGPEQVAFMVNLISALASAFTALFVCWTTTILARRGAERSGLLGRTANRSILAAGVVAGLSCAFADSIWFNAVEAEVYALSSFFTAIVVWLMFKWEARADEPGHLRWLVLIAYLMGLSIGVHLLNLLTIPALALVYFFRTHEFSWRGLLATLGISVAALAIIQYGIIQELFELAWGLEKWLTGTVARDGSNPTGLGLPVGTGFTVLMLLIVGALAGLLSYSHRKHRVILNTALLGLTVILIGFSSYAVIFIRSNDDPPIDMNNPENILTFLSYMRREQYGERPLLRGPMYQADVKRDARGYPVTESKGMKYVLLADRDRYVEDVLDQSYVYEEEVWFPRMWDPGRYNAGPFGYVNFVERKGQDKQSPYDDKPTAGENFRFFLSYQLKHMYFRYFMWNFAGRESDIQDARWESGLEFWDESRWTEDLTRNKGKNHYYFLPLLLGLLGLAWHVIVRRQDAAVIGLLFFFTGIAIILYLNQYPFQPRERDYSYAGSFQTFAIWIGLGVMFLVDLLRKYLRTATPWVAGGLALIVPALMLAENWDDHTRKGRYLDVEFAQNLLESCEENAILFTGGDNDTFPLWYVQEVEGFRTDVRVVNLELLISDWYIEQMQQPKNQSSALPITMDKAEYSGERDLVYSGYPSRTIALPAHATKLAEEGILSPAEASMAGDTMYWDFQTRGSSRNPYILRKDSAMIDLLRNVAANGWERPVYFANTMSPSNFLGLQDYLRMEGLAYRVLPVKRTEATINDIYYGRIDRPRMTEALIQDFRYRGLDDPSVNFDEHTRNVIIGNYRNAFFRLANTYAEEIILARTRLRGLDSAKADLEMVPDSLTALQQDLREEVAAAQTEIQQLMRVAEEKMPHAVLPRNLTLLITQAQMLNQAELGELAWAEFERLAREALIDLRGNLYRGVPFDRENLALRASLISMQFFAQQGDVERAGQLANEIQRITGLDFGAGQ